jgi:uncharacterized protein (TIGR03085 family)
MGEWSGHERTAVLDALEEFGPDAPTLCEGWDGADMAAHLYVRERRPDAAIGVLPLGPLTRYNARVMASAKRTMGFEEIVRRLRHVPAYLRIGPIDELINTIEFFVHTEDVRRANGAGPRAMPDEFERVVWGRLRRQARLSFRRFDGCVRIVPSVGDPVEVGSGEPVELRGRPSEICLLAYNRKEHAEVELTGNATAVERLRQTQLGL